MAFKKYNEMKIILLLVLLGVPYMASVGIDCAGRSFHCVNNTHFIICVDLGGGVSMTVDRYTIPCPTSTTCHQNNRFECEFEAPTPAPTIRTTSDSAVTNELSASTQSWEKVTVSSISIGDNHDSAYSHLTNSSITEDTTLPATTIPSAIEISTISLKVNNENKTENDNFTHVDLQVTTEYLLKKNYTKHDVLNKTEPNDKNMQNSTQFLHSTRNTIVTTTELINETLYASTTSDPVTENAVTELNLIQTGLSANDQLVASQSNASNGTTKLKLDFNTNLVPQNDSSTVLNRSSTTLSSVANGLKVTTINPVESLNISSLTASSVVETKSITTNIPLSPDSTEPSTVSFSETEMHQIPTDSSITSNTDVTNSLYGMYQTERDTLGVTVKNSDSATFSTTLKDWNISAVMNNLTTVVTNKMKDTLNISSTKNTTIGVAFYNATETHTTPRDLNTVTGNNDLATILNIKKKDEMNISTTQYTITGINYQNTTENTMSEFVVDNRKKHEVNYTNFQNNEANIVKKDQSTLKTAQNTVDNQTQNMLNIFTTDKKVIIDVENNETKDPFNTNTSDNRVVNEILKDQTENTLNSITIKNSLDIITNNNKNKNVLNKVVENTDITDNIFTELSTESTLTVKDMNKIKDVFNATNAENILTDILFNKVVNDTSNTLSIDYTTNLVDKELKNIPIIPAAENNVTKIAVHIYRNNSNSLPQFAIKTEANEYFNISNIEYRVTTEANNYEINETQPFFVSPLPGTKSEGVSSVTKPIGETIIASIEPNIISSGIVSNIPNVTLTEPNNVNTSHQDKIQTSKYDGNNILGIDTKNKITDSASKVEHKQIDSIDFPNELILTTTTDSGYMLSNEVNSLGSNTSLHIIEVSTIMTMGTTSSMNEYSTRNHNEDDTSLTGTTAITQESNINILTHANKPYGQLDITQTMSSKKYDTSTERTAMFDSDTGKGVIWTYPEQTSINLAYLNQNTFTTNPNEGLITNTAANYEKTSKINNLVHTTQNNSESLKTESQITSTTPMTADVIPDKDNIIISATTLTSPVTVVNRLPDTTESNKFSTVNNDVNFETQVTENIFTNVITEQIVNSIKDTKNSSLTIDGLKDTILREVTNDAVVPPLVTKKILLNATEDKIVYQDKIATSHPSTTSDGLATNTGNEYETIEKQIVDDMAKNVEKTNNSKIMPITDIRFETTTFSEPENNKATSQSSITTDATTESSQASVNTIILKTTEQSAIHNEMLNWSESQKATGITNNMIPIDSFTTPANLIERNLQNLDEAYSFVSGVEPTRDSLNKNSISTESLVTIENTPIVRESAVYTTPNRDTIGNVETGTESQIHSILSNNLINKVLALAPPINNTQENRLMSSTEVVETTIASITDINGATYLSVSEINSTYVNRSKNYPKDIIVLDDAYSRPMFDTNHNHLLNVSYTQNSQSKILNSTTPNVKSNKGTVNDEKASFLQIVANSISTMRPLELPLTSEKVKTSQSDSDLRNKSSTVHNSSIYLLPNKVENGIKTLLIANSYVTQNNLSSPNYNIEETRPSTDTFQANVIMNEEMSSKSANSQKVTLITLTNSIKNRLNADNFQATNTESETTLPSNFITLSTESAIQGSKVTKEHLHKTTDLPSQPVNKTYYPVVNLYSILSPPELKPSTDIVNTTKIDSDLQTTVSMILDFSKNVLPKKVENGNTAILTEKDNVTLSNLSSPNYNIEETLTSTDIFQEHVNEEKLSTSVNTQNFTLIALTDLNKNHLNATSLAINIESKTTLPSSFITSSTERVIQESNNSKALLDTITNLPSQPVNKKFPIVDSTSTVSSLELTSFSGIVTDFSDQKLENEEQQAKSTINSNDVLKTTSKYGPNILEPIMHSKDKKTAAHKDATFENTQGSVSDIHIDPNRITKDSNVQIMDNDVNKSILKNTWSPTDSRVLIESKPNTKLVVPSNNEIKGSGIIGTTRFNESHTITPTLNISIADSSLSLGNKSISCNNSSKTGTKLLPIDISKTYTQTNKRSITNESTLENHIKNNLKHQDLANSKALSTKKTFNCLNRHRGRYGDNDDCRKFYICIGRLQAIEGECPVNTVFSEIWKRCTRNLSHCVRNDEFKCIKQERIVDLRRHNTYYVCAKNNHGTFTRFKFQCQRDYTLDKSIIKCVQNADNSNQSVSSKVPEKKSQAKVRKSNSSEMKTSKENKSMKNFLFECENTGKFPVSENCREYYVCSINNKSKYRRRKKKCDSDEVFDKDKNKCVDTESYEC